MVVLIATVIVKTVIVKTKIETIVIAMTEKDILHATTARRLADPLMMDVLMMDVLMMDVLMMEHAKAIFPAVAQNQNVVLDVDTKVDVKAPPVAIDHPGILQIDTAKWIVAHEIIAAQINMPREMTFAAALVPAFALVRVPASNAAEDHRLPHLPNVDLVAVALAPVDSDLPALEAVVSVLPALALQDLGVAMAAEVALAVSAAHRR